VNYDNLALTGAMVLFLGRLQDHPLRLLSIPQLSVDQPHCEWPQFPYLRIW